jgi:hypothetical protein
MLHGISMVEYSVTGHLVSVSLPDATLNPFHYYHFPRSFSTRMAALCPAHPMTEPAG